jgi:hypothetical protein
MGHPERSQVLQAASQPQYDLKPGLATVWPEFAEAAS